MYFVANCTEKLLKIRTLVNNFCKNLNFVLNYLENYPNNMRKGGLKQIYDFLKNFFKKHI